jgi:hypothetical protein
VNEIVDKQLDYRDSSPILIAIGVLAFLVGLGAAFLGPVEMYCFYLFGEGGRFHYPGFGFGSFMFGNIATQIAGYYLIAALFLPLGYGHIARRRWARPLALALLWFWLILGIPLGILSVAITFASTGYLELLAIAGFPERELEFLDGIPLQGYHLASFFGVPLLAILALLVFSRQSFGDSDPQADCSD